MRYLRVIGDGRPRDPNIPMRGGRQPDAPYGTWRRATLLPWLAVCRVESVTADAPPGVALSDAEALMLETVAAGHAAARQTFAAARCGPDAKREALRVLNREGRLSWALVEQIVADQHLDD
jgi:hypothetical protein